MGRCRSVGIVIVELAVHLAQPNVLFVATDAILLNVGTRTRAMNINLLVPIGN